jgi:hypothetical protein
LSRQSATTNYFPPKSLRERAEDAIWKARGFLGETSQLVGELHLLAAMHFARRFWCSDLAFAVEFCTKLFVEARVKMSPRVVKM